MANAKKDSKGRKLNKGEQQRNDGTYHYTYLDSNKRRKYIYAKMLVELREKEEQLQRDLLDGIDSASSKMTLNQLFQIYINLKKDLRASTRVNYVKRWEYSIQNTPLAKMKICDIKQIHIKSFYKDCAEKGLKKNTIKLFHGLIYATLDVAIDSDFIRKNPAKNCMKFLENDTEEKTPLTMDEVTDLINFCRKSSVYNIHVPFLVIAIGTCLRCGEITGLTWNDVDLKNKVIHINHQLIYKNLGDGCKFHISEPKTAAGKRSIPMNESVYKAFIEIRKQNFMLGRSSKVEIDGYKDFVFVSRNGQPYAINGENHFLLNIEKAFNKTYPESNISHISAHILRHTGCTLYASAGMDIKALQDIMGHTDASITMNVYNHSNFERTEKEMNRIDMEMIG